MKYSRKQIVEAIKFWTKVLESTSPFIDMLVEHYGYDVVFKDDAKITLNLRDIQHIHKYASEAIFKNDIGSISIRVDTKKEFISGDIIADYEFTAYESPLGTWNFLKRAGIDKNGNVYDASCIYVSSDAVGKQISLIELSNIVVHEMIHQFVVEHAISNELYEIINDVNSQHNSTFKQMMNDINSNHGLNIVESGSASYEVDSFNVLKKFAGNDYEKLREVESSISCKVIRKSKDGRFVDVMLV